MRQWWRRMLRGWPRARWEVAVGEQTIALQVHRKSVRLYVDDRVVARVARDRDGPAATLRGSLRNGRLVPLPLEVEASVIEIDGSVHGVIRHQGQVLAGAPLPRRPTDLAAQLRIARRRLVLFADAGIHTHEVEALERAVEGASSLSALLETTAELEVWARANH